MTDLQDGPPGEHPNSMQFSTTHWSLVLAAGRRGTVESDSALERLCKSYWPPLYVYVRRRVSDLHEAQDLTQAFFERLLDRGYLAEADPERGRFRAFLLTAFKHFLSKEWEKARTRKRGGGRRRIAFDFMSQGAMEPADHLTPEKLFERQWAITLLGRVMQRLQRDMERGGKGRQFELLKHILSGDNSALTLADIAAELGQTETATRMAASRMRSRYRELLREEISRTLSSQDDVEDEIRSLFAAEPHRTNLLWDVDRGAVLKRFSDLPSYVHALAWSPAARPVWSENWNRLAIVDLETGDATALVETPSNVGITFAAFDPSGWKLALGCSDGSIRIDDIVKSRTLLRIQASADRIAALSWSVDGKMLAAASNDGLISILDGETGELRHRLRGHSSSALALAWNPDSRQLASGGNDRTIRIWNADDGRLLRTLTGHVEVVTGVAWHPDGNRVASGAFDGTIKLWDAETWREILSLRAHVQAISNGGFAWSPNGHQLASGSIDRTIIVWGAVSADKSTDLSGHRNDLNLAKRLLALGATLDLGELQVSNLAAHPRGKFSIRGVSFPAGSVLTAGDFEGLDQLDLLESLNLKGTLISDPTIEALTRLKQVRGIDLSETRLSHKAVDRLKSAMPQCTVRWQDFPVDLAAAKQILSLGGSVIVFETGNKITINRRDDIPPYPFRVVEANLKDQPQVKDDDLACLSELTAMEKVNLFGTGMTDEGMKHLRGLTKLTHLDFGNTHVSGAGLAYLADLSELRRIDCSQMSRILTDHGLSHLPSLPRLNYWGGNLGDPVTDEALVHFRRLPELESFVVWRSGLNGEGIRHLAGHPKLRRVVLTSVRLADENLEHLKELPALRELELRHCNTLTDACLQQVGQLAELNSLSFLNISITDRGLEELAALKKLEHLKLKETKVTAAGVERLRAELPNCQIEWDGSHTQAAIDSMTHH